MRWLVLLALLAAGCEREQRQYQLATVQASFVKQGHVTTEKNAYALSQGKTLFRWFNCSGCHSNGGGGMGPALMDDKWRYGNNPEDIYASIMEGRPNGMPSFKGRINEDQAWQLVAYVRSIAGLTPRDALPGRAEHMQSVPTGTNVP